jgi:type I restriction enzyme S subunit
MVFRCIDDHESGISADYLDQFRSSLQWERFVSGNGDGGVRIRIYYKDLALLSMGLPSLLEQRKIASCLSTLDELIGAQGRKVAALRTHKKGLMQQLFPREGETQPRLRFPEFQDAGDWESKRLIALCKRIMDGTHFSPKTKEGPRPYLTSKNIRMGWLDLSTVSYISEVEHKSIYARCPVEKYDVLLTKDGANTGNCAINNIDGQFSLLSSVAVLRGDPEQVTQHFLYQAIASDGMQSTIANSMTGQAITRITLEKLGNYAVSVPSISEQQRIASCLSSLDELITAETQKLEALKTHKRGLMQQLFPSPEDAS